MPQYIDVSHTYFADVAQAREARRVEEARQLITPEAVLSEVQSLALGIARDQEHPLYPLVAACVRRGTPGESGIMPHVAAQVGAAFLPIIERAIARLVQEQLMLEVGDDGF